MLAMKRGRLLLVLGLLVACGPVESKPRGGLVLATSTDMQIPKDITHVGVQIIPSSGVPVLENWYSLWGSEQNKLPATLTVEPGQTGGSVRIRVFGRRQSDVLTLKEATTTVPRDRVALLRMPIEWLSKGMVRTDSTGFPTEDDAGSMASAADGPRMKSWASTCPTGQTAQAGECVSSAVDSSKLLTYWPGAVYGGAGSDATCFDTVKCFKTPVYVTISDRSQCIAQPVAGVDPKQLTLGLVPADGSGICGPGGCVVPLDFVASGSDGSGWTLEKDGAHLPHAVCTKLDQGSVRAVVAATQCPSKTAETPTCGPWSSVGAGEAPPTSDLVLLDLCRQFVQQVCAEVTLCRGGADSLLGAALEDNGTCPSRLGLLCDNSLAQPEAEPWRQFFLDCGAAFSNPDCASAETEIRVRCVEPAASVKNTDQPCVFGECGAGAACFGAVPGGQGTCRLRLEVGALEQCGTGTAVDTVLPQGLCQAGLLCEAGMQCRLPGGAGATCTDDQACEAGLVCSLGACDVAVPAGEGCFDDSQCGPGLHCIGSQGSGVCRGPGGDGDSCQTVTADAAVQWEDNLCDPTKGLRCNPTGWVCAPAVPAAAGAACSTNSSCDGGYCSGRTGDNAVDSTCQSYVPDGAGCQVDAQCMPPSLCLDGLCRLRPAFGCNANTMLDVPGGGACASGQTNCSGSCVDLATNANNCGQCGVVCPSGKCEARACTALGTGGNGGGGGTAGGSGRGGVPSGGVGNSGAGGSAGSTGGGGIALGGAPRGGSTSSGGLPIEVGGVRSGGTTSSGGVTGVAGDARGGGSTSSGGVTGGAAGARSGGTTSSGGVTGFTGGATNAAGRGGGTLGGGGTGGAAGADCSGVTPPTATGSFTISGGYGYATTGSLQGYAYTFTDTQGSCVTPSCDGGCGLRVPDGSALCGAGTVVPSYGWAGLGFNFNQSAGNTTPGTVPAPASITVSYTNPGASPLRVQVWDGTTNWCVDSGTFTSGQAISISSFNTACWDKSGTYLTPGTPIASVSLVVPGGATMLTPFSMCLTGVTFTGGSGEAGGAGGTGASGAGGGLPAAGGTASGGAPAGGGAGGSTSAAGGAPGGTAAGGGPTGGSGGASGGSTTLSVTGQGYVSSGVWHGYASVGTDTNGTLSAAPTITSSPSGASVCLAGSVNQAAPGYAALAANLNQLPGGSPEAVTPAGAGVWVGVANQAGSPLLLQMAGPNAATDPNDRWCAPITGVGGFIPWSSFNTDCITGSGNPYGQQPLVAVAIVVPGSPLAAVPFGFCLTQIGEAQSVPPELVSAAGWVGGDASLTTDDPLGIQGGFYLFGDGIACSPPAGNPCGTSGCCLHGQTTVDTTYQAWGCGIGLELRNVDGKGTLNPYTGPADCFDLVLTGSSGNNRVFLTARASRDVLPNGETDPMVEIPPFSNGWSGHVCLGNLTCSSGSPSCRLTGEWYNFQVSVVGGENESSFDLCLQSLQAIELE
jgi:hypothetical protein